MKRHFIVSLLVHLFLLFGITFVQKEQDKEEQKKDKPKNTAKTEKQAPVSVEILELSPVKSEKPAPQNFYWGIGISSRDNDYLLPGAGFYPNCRLVSDITKGYTADSSGLQVGDIVILIDGKVLGAGNDLRGDEPRKMILTVYRNGVTIKISIERTKVYYYK